MDTLVVGATGLVGSEIARRLKALGHRVVGLVRPGSAKARGLSAAGIETRVGDLRDPASLRAACEGVEAVISTATAVTSGGAGNSLTAVDRDGHRGLLEAARAAGASRFLYVSTSPKYGASPLIAGKRETEQLVKDSGLRWTVLQPSLFMDIWFSPAVGWSLLEGRARIFGRGDAPISWICSRDVAAYAAAAVAEPKAFGQSIPLGGPEALSPRAALEVVEGVVGRRFKVTVIPRVVAAAGGALLRPLNPKLASLMALGVETTSGDVIAPEPARSIVQLPFVRLADWAREAARAPPG